MKPDMVKFEHAVTELFRNEGGSATFAEWYCAYWQALSHVAFENYWRELEDSEIDGQASFE
jgi:hypothetical protein